MNWNAAFAIVLIATLLLGPVLRAWLWRRYQAGQITGRAAGWIYAGAAATPFLLLVGWTAITDAGSLWIMIPILILVVPVMIVPWVAMFRYPRDR